MPIEKLTKTDDENLNDSLMHPFDRFTPVYARADGQSFALDPILQEREETDANSQVIPENGEKSQGGWERLRSEIITRAREAEERERDATERYKQIEAKYRQEQALQKLAEQRAEELEGEYKQRVASAQAADLLRLESELALAETKAKLKQELETLRLTETALSRVKEDARAQAQSSARALDEAENYILKLESSIDDLREKVTSLEEVQTRAAGMEKSLREAEEKFAALKVAEAKIIELEALTHDLKEKAASAPLTEIALDKAVKRIAELEATFHETTERISAAESNALALESELISTARSLGEKTAYVESLTLSLEETKKRVSELETSLQEADQKTIAALDEAKGLESLERKTSEKLKEVEKKLQDSETRLQLEISMRTAAESKLHELENKFKSELEMDWTRFAADLEQAEVVVKAREKAIANLDLDVAGRETDEIIQELSTQLGEEKRVRGEIERKLHELESRANTGRLKLDFEAERRLSEMDAALKEATSARVEAERKLAELTIGHAEQSLYGVNLDAPNTSLVVQKLSSVLDANREISQKEKIKLASLAAGALLLFEILVSSLVYLVHFWRAL